MFPCIRITQCALSLIGITLEQIVTKTNLSSYPSVGKWHSGEEQRDFACALDDLDFFFQLFVFGFFWGGECFFLLLFFLPTSLLHCVLRIAWSPRHGSWRYRRDFLGRVQIDIHMQCAGVESQARTYVFRGYRMDPYFQDLEGKRRIYFQGLFRIRGADPIPPETTRSALNMDDLERMAEGYQPDPQYQLALMNQLQVEEEWELVEPIRDATW